METIRIDVASKYISYKNEMQVIRKQLKYAHFCQ